MDMANVLVLLCLRLERRCFSSQIALRELDLTVTEVDLTVTLRHA